MSSYRVISETRLAHWLVSFTLNVRLQLPIWSFLPLQQQKQKKTPKEEIEKNLSPLHEHVRNKTDTIFCLSQIDW